MQVDTRHFTRATTQLGHKQTVVATRTITSEQGTKILEKGAAVREESYARLVQSPLSVPLEDSVATSDLVTPASLRQQAEELARNVPFFERLVTPEAGGPMILAAIGAIPLPEPVALQLTVAREVRPEVYSQLVRTCLVCTWLANVPGVSRYELGMAAAAGMLHDIGMLHLDPVLTQSYQILSPELRSELYAHPALSVGLLSRHHQYPAEVLRAIGEHQEYMDGSGYPRGLQARYISPLGRILALSQVAAAMFAPGRDAPEMRISVLLRMTTNLYDNKLAARLLTQLQPRALTDAARPRMQDPVRPMLEVDRLLGDLPQVMASVRGAQALQEPELQTVVQHALRIRRGLARVGAAPQQLASLGDTAMDEGLLDELALLTGEAVWQLRTLARHATRRLQDSIQKPEGAQLQDWLQAVDTVVGQAGQPA